MGDHAVAYWLQKLSSLDVGLSEWQNCSTRSQVLPCQYFPVVLDWLILSVLLTPRTEYSHKTVCATPKLYYQTEQTMADGWTNEVTRFFSLGDLDDTGGRDSSSIVTGVISTLTGCNISISSLPRDSWIHSSEQSMQRGHPVRRNTSYIRSWTVGDYWIPANTVYGEGKWQFFDWGWS